MQAPLRAAAGGAVDSCADVRQIFPLSSTSPPQSSAPSIFRNCLRFAFLLPVTTVLPTSRRSVSSKATFIPSCEVRPAPLSLPRYGLMCRQYTVAASHKHQNFSPYFAGFEGMYCLKLQRPRKGTNVSSTVRY